MMIGVVGAGAWGTALAQLAAANGESVVLWAREDEVVRGINEACENPLFLPGIPLSPSIVATMDPAGLDDCHALLVVAPAQHLGSVLAGIDVGTRPLVLCAKGIEDATGRLMSEVAQATCPRAPIAVLSGPTFAHEVARGLPTAVTLASEDADLVRRLSDRLASATFRPYQSSDVVGAEIGGAVKNVVAIACGVVAGLGLGENARAALIARGSAEMTRFGVARGGRAETLAGLSGLGDLVLTCSSTQSRNFSLGVALGQGAATDTLVGAARTVAEGAFIAPVLAREAARVGVDMPVVAAVCALIEGRTTARQAAEALMSRPLRGEVA